MCEEGILGSEHLVWTLVSTVLSLGSSTSCDTWSASSSAASRNGIMTRERGRDRSEAFNLIQRVRKEKGEYCMQSLSKYIHT